MQGESPHQGEELGARLISLVRERSHLMRVSYNGLKERVRHKENPGKD